MVIKTKTYGKKKGKGRDIASLFVDLSISPSKPGVYEIRFKSIKLIKNGGANSESSYLINVG